MRLIIGLGNPGEKFERTRHNLGFMVLEKIAQKGGVVFNNNSDFEARTAQMGDSGNQNILIMPQTYMNDSGRAVVKIKNYYRAENENIWIVHDDVDLDFGKIKINFGGRSAGHKGVQSIIDNIDESFWRIRIGVGKSEKIPTEEWVLVNFEKDANDKLEEIIDKIADFLIESINQGINQKTIII